jgi:hypothetical protein
VSKSSLFLLSVAFLAAAASLRSDGERPGYIGQAVRFEARDDIASLQDDAHVVRHQAEWAPHALARLWDDIRGNLRTLEADLAAEARIAAQRF